jgi:hypothetical protein
VKIWLQNIPLEFIELYDSFLCRGHKYRYIPIHATTTKCPLIKHTNLGSLNPKVTAFKRWPQVR